jgi:hypothetical protein
MADENLYRGLIHVHVLHHAAEGRIFGLKMMSKVRVWFDEFS